MNTLRRTSAAVAVSVALAIAPVAAPAEAGSPGKGGSAAVKAQARAALKDIAVKDRALARVQRTKSLLRLADAHEVALVASIGDDRAELAELRAEASSSGTAAAARALRAEVRAFRVEVFTQAIGLVRRAEHLAIEAADDVEAGELVDLAVTSALVLDSHSTRAEVKAVRGLLDQAEAELLEDDPEEPVDPEDPEDPVDPVDPV